MPFGIIYQIKNRINGKTYIGQTRHSFKRRYKKSWWINHHNAHVRRAVAKYGVENFEISIIDTAESQEELNRKESAHILEKNHANPRYGYNRTMNTNGLDPSDPRVQRYIARESERKSKAQSRAETRAKKSSSLKTAHARASWVPEIVAGIRAYHSDPEKRREFAAANSRAWSEERRKKNSERMKLRYADPKEREKQSKRMIDALASDVSALQRRKEQLAQHRAKAIANSAAALAKRNHDPEMQKSMAYRAALVRQENARRAGIGLPKMTRSESVEFLRTAISKK